MPTCKHCQINYNCGRNEFGFYCSNKCQQHHQSQQRFLSGKSSNRSARRNLLEIHGNKCSICELQSWMGDVAPLIVDHIDGDYRNNSPENLRLVCPNCDAQLPTYKGRNRGKGRVLRMKRYHEGKSY